MEIEVEFVGQASQKINEMKLDANVGNASELVSRALRLYEWYLLKEREGWRLRLCRGDSIREIKKIVF